MPELFQELLTMLIIVVGGLTSVAFFIVGIAVWRGELPDKRRLWK